MRAKVGKPYLPREGLATACCRKIRRHGMQRIEIGFNRER